MYQVVLAKIAKKQLKKLDPRYKSAVNKAINKLAKNPKIGKPLGGELKGSWKLRFSRYRIIYLIQGKKLIVYIIDVKHRKDVYQ